MNNGPFVLTRYDIAAIITEESPRAAELLAEFGLACMGCYFSETDTIETGAKVHGLTGTEIDDMVEEINLQLEKEWNEEHKK